MRKGGREGVGEIGAPCQTTQWCGSKLCTKAAKVCVWLKTVQPLLKIMLFLFNFFI